MVKLPKNINLGKKSVHVLNVVQMLFPLNVKPPIHGSSSQSDENMVYICTFVFSWLAFNYPHRKKIHKMFHVLLF